MFLKNIKRRAVLSLLASLTAFAVTTPFAMTQAMAQEKTHITLGVMEGEEGDVWKTAAEEAKKNGLDVELRYFSDYTLPNEALNAGDINSNSFQHKPYLDAQIEQRGYKLTAVGDTFLFPIGVYSRKIKDIKELRDGAVVGIPNDPSNGGRALLILESLGLIKLKDPTNIMATKIDIAENPKNLDIQEMDAGMLGGAINDFDIALVNTNWALTTGLKPETDAIAWESANKSPYTNLIVVRTEDKDAPWIKTLVSSFQSEPVRAKIKEVFGTTAITSW